jgi:pimeloyl-ACP methyl ester carboxylesterase
MSSTTGSGPKMSEPISETIPPNPTLSKQIRPGEIFMSTQFGHQNAPNLFIEARNAVRYAYCRFGKNSGVPLVFLKHFRGNLDNWDPYLTDSIAAQREVIVLDNVGVGLPSGTTPNTVAQMARDAIVFLDEIALTQVDLLGLSLGGFVAQEIALLRPKQVRKLVLAGTGPQGGSLMHGWRKDIADAARKPDLGGAGFLYVFFAHTETSQSEGAEFLTRFLLRIVDRDVPSRLVTRGAQYDAIVEWGIPDHNKLQRLANIRQPSLAASGNNDLMIPTRLTHLLGALIRNAEVRTYPDAAHGFLFQYPEEFGNDVNLFLG